MRNRLLTGKMGLSVLTVADLEMTLRQLARWYDVSIIFEGAIPKKKFSGEMQRDLSLSQVIKLLEKNNVYCRIEGKNLVVLE
jgi:hypothetical protein